jgi:hypothetical protein
MLTLSRHPLMPSMYNQECTIPSRDAGENHTLLVVASVAVGNVLILVIGDGVLRFFG